MGSGRTSDSLIPGNRTSGDTRVFPQTDSSARKYTAPDHIETWPDVSKLPWITSNAEHLVNAAAGMRSLSLAVDALVKDARTKTQAVRAAITSISKNNGK